MGILGCGSLCGIRRPGGTVVPPFSPSDLSGLQLWYAADSLALSDGAQVSSWTDLSGNNRHATQGTSSRRPVYKTGVANGKPGVRFDGVDDCLAIAYSPVMTDLTAFVVFYDRGSLASARLVEKSRITGFYTGVNPNLAGSYGGGVLEASTPFGQFITGTGNPYLLCLHRTGATHTVRLDGASVTKGTGQSGATDTTQFQLGTRDTANGMWTGDMLEILVYNTYLSTDNRASVEAFLTSKYAL